MSGPLTALALFKNKYFARYRAEIIRILKYRIRGSAYESDDAGMLLPDWDILKLLAAARAALAAHAARTDNPHQETMSTIGGYTAAEANAKIAAKIPLAVLPFSTYGWLKGTMLNVRNIWTSSGFTITCTQAVPVILSGTPYTMPITTLNLAIADPAPANKTFYVYVKQRYGIVQYDVRTDAPPEAAGVMYIGTVSTNGTGVSFMSFEPVVRVGTFRTYIEPRGSVIPVSAGPIDNPTKFPATWNPV